MSEQGVYVFPRLTILGYDKHEAPIQRLQQLGFQLEDANTRNEGIEIKGKSPFCLMRTLAEEFGFKMIKMVASEAPGDRSGLMWTLVEADNKKGVESVGIVADIRRESGNTDGTDSERETDVVCCRRGRVRHPDLHRLRSEGGGVEAAAQGGAGA